jgi:hypothetical protein
MSTSEPQAEQEHRPSDHVDFFYEWWAANRLAGDTCPGLAPRWAIHEAFDDKILVDFANTRIRPRPCLVTNPTPPSDQTPPGPVCSKTISYRPKSETPAGVTRQGFFAVDVARRGITLGVAPKTRLNDQSPSTALITRRIYGQSPRHAGGSPRRQISLTATVRPPPSKSTKAASHRPKRFSISERN